MLVYIEDGAELAQTDPQLCIIKIVGVSVLEVPRLIYLVILLWYTVMVP